MSILTCGCGSRARAVFALVRVDSGELIEDGAPYVGCVSSCAKYKRASFKAAHRASLYIPANSVTVRIRRIEPNTEEAAA